MLWCQAFEGLVTTSPSNREEEDIVHDLCSVIDGLDSLEEIERALIDVAGWLTRGGTAWLGGGSPDGGPTEVGRAEAPSGVPDLWEFPLRFVEDQHLFVAPRAECSPSSYRRLRTLVVVADAAASRLRWDQASRPPWHDGEFGRPGEGCLQHDLGTGLECDELGSIAIPVVQDATFIKAVLPFATRQAKRHREPLCLIYMTIDRLPGIREMLGDRAVEQAVARVGEKVVSILRASDVVARLEDNRFLAILPRACLANGLAVADKICRSVQRAPELFPELGGLTVSAGVAEYPSSADSVPRLIEEADAALDQAQARGRNRAVAATGAAFTPALVG
ncbi:GGDEF domain-containing protein [Aquisphaera insulae]|uniref:GGDEF domain-containing protein n=1 Tax=Aquisphaera insulae TaxID=2712864 RepID=UPI0013EE29BB|nr:diguanylate cyclase [Aquisphaera insulae]